MPLDSLNFVPAAERIATPAEFWDAEPHERLVMLAFALRHMPDSHHWDFSRVDSVDGWRPDCGSAGCAYGLADGLWGRQACAAATVSMKFWDEVKIFGILTGRHYGRPRRAVCPYMVADAIDAYLARA